MYNKEPPWLIAYSPGRYHIFSITTMPIAQHQWGLATLESASTLMSISANSSATSLQLDNPLRIRYKLKILQNICNSISNSYPIIDLCLSIKKGSIIA